MHSNDQLRTKEENMKKCNHMLRITLFNMCDWNNDQLNFTG